MLPRYNYRSEYIVPYATPTCQLEHAIDGDSPVKSTPAQAASVRGAAQNIEHTASRRTGPRRWLRAVEWLIAAGLHPRANATTLAVARDLGARMDYDTGHVRYCRDDMVTRTGISRASITKHVGYLRELGALAWSVHGTRANIRRALGLKGYAGTATVYAATIPPVYDRAMGHRIIGTGYEARFVVDLRGQAKPVDNFPVDNPGSGSCEPPSLTVVKEVGQVQVESGFNYTSRKRASRSTAPIPHQTKSEKRSSGDGARRRTPAQVEWEIRETRLVRALVNWTQAERCIRRLSFVLRPFFDRGLRGHDIAAELGGMALGWKPKRPAAFIRVALAEQASADAQLAADEARRESATWRDRASLAALFAPAEPTETEPVRTDADRTAARLITWNNWPEVAAHYADDKDDAIDLYGERLVTFALNQEARINGHREMTHV